MPHSAHIALRVIAAVAGALSLYAALFLYEDDQGRIENRLEEWWVRLDDQRNAAVSRHTAFMREVARLAGRGFDRLFGHRLFSLQAFGASSALSMSTFWAMLGGFNWLISAAFVALCLCCTMIPAVSRRTIATLGVFVPLILTLAFGAYTIHKRSFLGVRLVAVEPRVLATATATSPSSSRNGREIA